MFERYIRQILFPEIGREGQERLSLSTVMLVGCGALGASHAETFARAGVGRLKIVDRDFVEYSNLQRQSLFTETDASNHVPKAAAAKARLVEINSSVEVEAIITDINNSNVESLIDGCDLVVDGSDNFQVRYLVNDACVKADKPWIYGAAVSSYGATMTIIPGRTPCLRCIFEEMPDAGTSPTCDTSGVIMPIIASISAVQSAEAIKYLVGDIESLHGSLLQIDIWQNDWRKIKLGSPNPDCVTCGRRNFQFLDAEASGFAAVLCGRDAVQIVPPQRTSINLNEFSSRIALVTGVTVNEYLVRFDADGREMTVFADGRAIIKGTDDIAAARSLYARYVGS
ncbi:MAG: ThiF family adenylyltransferase [Acidobacteriota bacterium]